MENSKAIFRLVGLVFGVGLAFATAARAEYRCDPPVTRIDRMACEEAKHGPDNLRQFIQRMRVIESLYFFDYVNEETLLAWREMERANEPPAPEQQARVSR